MCVYIHVCMPDGSLIDMLQGLQSLALCIHTCFRNLYFFFKAPPVVHKL